MGGHHHVPAAISRCLIDRRLEGARGPVRMDKENLAHIRIRTPNRHCTDELSWPLRITLYRDTLVSCDTRRTRYTPTTVHPSLLTDNADSCDICGAHSGGDVEYDNLSAGKQSPTFRSCCLQLQDVYPSWTKEAVTSFETSVTIYQYSRRHYPQNVNLPVANFTTLTRVYRP
jgi:hypothetical protein